jgi:hypothetical protein
VAGFNPVGTDPVASIGTSGYSPAPGGIVFRGSNVLPDQVQVSAGHFVVHGVTPTAVLGPPRVTWIGVEALHGGVAAGRVTWQGVEVLRSVTSVPTDWVVSLIGLEALHTGASSARVTWIGAETLHAGAAADRVTWIGMEVLRSVADRQPDSGWVCLIAA